MDMLPMPPRNADSLNSPKGIATTIVTVFHIGAQDRDLDALADIVAGADWKLCPNTRWSVAAADDLPSAASTTPIVLCERESDAGTWKDILESIGRFPTPPMLIVASRMADERLWAEALSLGAYDVLSKPYQASEVIRVLSMAWLHWSNSGKKATLAQAS